MEKGEVGPPGQEGQTEKPGEEAILHYEEHITGLLVTIARLQGKIEHLQRKEARQEEGFSDLGSESTASLPRCPSLFAVPTRSPSPPPADLEEGKADLFLDVHKAVTSLENIVLSYRSRLPSVEAERDGCAQGAEDLEARLAKLHQGSLGPFHQVALEPTSERTITLYKEKNAALRAQLGAKEEALSRSSASLSAYQEERSKLQRKVKELQESLSRLEICSDGVPGPLGEQEPRAAQDLSGAAPNGLHPPGAALSIQPAHSLSASAPMETHSSLEQLRRSVERLWRLNRLLSGALQESKTEAERISLLLGRRESDHTALALAVRCSGRCLEAYKTLLALTELEPKASPEMAGEVPWAGGSHNANPALEKARRFLQACSTAGRSPWEQDGTQERSLELLGVEEEAKEKLRGCIRRLRAEQGSLKLPIHQPPAGLGSVAARLNARIGAKVAEVQRAAQEALPSLATQPKREKGQLLRELHAAREALADLGTRLHLQAREKQGLELQTHTLQAQEAACLLLIQALQQEHRELQGPPSPRSSSSSSNEGSSGAPAPLGLCKRFLPAASKNVEGSLAKMEPEALMLRLLDTLARIRALKDRLGALLTDLEERSQDCRAHEAQETELMRDFFQAHSALLLAYQKARRKQEKQAGQLESQMGLMSGRQARQRQALMQALQQLQDRVPTRAPSGFPQAPASARRTPDPPGSLEPMSFFTEERVRLSGHTQQTRLPASKRASPPAVSH